MIKCSKDSVVSFIKQNLLILLTISGVIIGVILGLGLRNIDNGRDIWTPRNVMYVNLVGDLFLRLIKAIILPLIASSLVSAIGSLDQGMSKKIGSVALLYYVTTTFFAVMEGIVLAVTIKPGKGFGEESVSTEDNRRANVTTVDTLLDLVRNIFPPNLVQACIQQQQTVLTPPENNPSEESPIKWDISHRYVDGTNLIGIVAASIFFGVALSAVKDQVGTLLSFIQQFSFVVMKVTCWIIWYVA